MGMARVQKVFRGLGGLSPRAIFTHVGIPIREDVDSAVQRLAGSILIANL
jgi:hypothetical protein